jgi:flagellar biosynthesis protein FlhB
VPADTGGGERSELPTPKKLRDARDEGQVAFSPDVNTAGMLLIGFVLIAAMAPWWWSTMALILRRAITDQLTTDITDQHDILYLIGQYAPVAQWMIPFFGVILLAAIVLSVAQTGFGMSLKPLIPKVSRVSPLTGIQRLFGLRGLMRFVFSLLKLILVIYIAWYVLSQDIAQQTYVTTALAKRLGDSCWGMFVLAMKIIVVLALIAAGDYIFQRFQHIRDLMMTKQEIKEEMRQSEGDPLVKSKIRQIQRAMAQKRMMQEVPKADVVITNPTHVAVALKYDKQEMQAPIVVAKGYDAVAQRIKKIAAENNITMVENVELARALAKEVEIGRAIPVKWYQAVAEVLAVVYKLKKAG